MTTSGLVRYVLRSFIAFACWMGISASAAQFGDFTYTDDGTSITITDYPDDAVGAVEIPATIAGKPVTKIGNAAFNGSFSITSVIIPNSVTTIGQTAFYYCNHLTSVSIGNSVSLIAEYAFSWCSSLTTITIPSGVGVIASFAFANCSELERVYLRGGTPNMGSNVFDNTASSFTIYYPSGVQGFTTPIWKGYPAFPGVPPQFTSAAAPATGNVGIAYSHTFTATGTPDASFEVSSGVLPDGVSISVAGVISGIPTAAGTFTGTITASNGIPPDATQAFAIDTNEYRTLITGGPNGIVTGGAIYLLNDTATLTATPSPGYLFAGWTGDATGTDNPLSVLMDGNKAITATFSPDTNDTDSDGWTNYEEIVVYDSDPILWDTDSDGAKDSKDAFPRDPAETLDTDHDGTGDNADTDDDGDGLSDADELNIHHTNPKRADSDGDGLTDPAEVQTYQTDPNVADTDDDGLSDGAEVNTYGTLPKVRDTDTDGFLDGYEVLTGKSPLDSLDKPALVAEARTAIEFTFPAAIGKTYRIEDSTDLATWGTVESGIIGTGGQVQRFYSTRNTPKRYFRVEEDTP